MANVIIIDTGYPNINLDGTQTATASRTNSGTQINLDSVTIDYNRGVNSDDSPYPGQFTDSKINQSSVENPTITIKGIIKQYGTYSMDGTTSLTAHTLLLPILDKLCTTQDIKCLYYSKVTSSESYTESSNVYKGLIKALGESNKSDVHSGNPVPASTPHLHVLAKSFRATEDAKATTINWTLTLQVTN